MTYVTQTERKTFLDDAAALEPGNEVSITVRKLIAYWNAERRGYWIRKQVEKNLAERGLRTVPSFVDGWIDNTVRLIPLRDQDHTPTGDDADSVEETIPASDSQETQSDLMAGGLTFEDLDRALFEGMRPAVISAVSREDTLAKAQSLMMRYDYSQLPVMSSAHTCRGAVSWESIARTVVHKSGATLTDCIVPVDQLSLSDDVLSNVAKITANGFVVTKDGQGHVCGVVTTADISAAFEELSGPFLLIGIAEQLLRTVAESCFDPAAISAVASVKSTSRPVDGDLGGTQGVIRRGRQLDLTELDRRPQRIPGPTRRCLGHAQ